MFRPGTDPDNVQMSDVLCDFCHAVWTENLPLVEGHQGHVICGRCVRVAWLEVVSGGGGDGPGLRCSMCLEDRPDPCWTSPMHEQARICRRCIEMAAEALEGDAESGWRRP